MKFMAGFEVSEWDVGEGMMGGSRYSPDVATKLSEQRTDKLGRISEERRPRNPIPALRLPMGAGGRHVPKAQRLKGHGWGPRSCNKEGTRWG